MDFNIIHKKNRDSEESSNPLKTIFQQLSKSFIDRWNRPEIASKKANRKREREDSGIRLFTAVSRYFKSSATSETQGYPTDGNNEDFGQERTSEKRN